MTESEAEGLLALAMASQQAGAAAEAAAAYRRLLSLLPDIAELHNNLGVALKDLGQAGAAAAAYRQAIALKPAYPEAHNNLGVACKDMGQADAAVAAYRRAIAVRPTYAEAHNNLGVMLKALNRGGEAADAYCQAIGCRADYPEAYNNLGVLLLEAGQIDEAIAACGQAVTLDGGFAVAWYNLGNAVAKAGRMAEAITAYGQATALDPRHADAHNNLGGALKALGRIDAARGAFAQALALRPEDAQAWSNLGTVLVDAGHAEDALAAYRRAIACLPHFAEAYANLANGLLDLGRTAEAIAACRRALAISPDLATALAALVHLKQRACDWSDWQADQARLLDAVRHRDARIAPLILVSTGAVAADQLLCASRWVADGGGATPPRIGGRPAGGKIRLGYLSADFHAHATAYLAAELFERHDRARFAVTAYSYGPDDGSDMRRRLTGAFDRFVDIRALSHGEAAQRIHADGIDILVDLKGHTHGARPAILAARPAPVQVNFLGYPGTMGAGFIDYLIADPFVAPFDHQPFFTEALVHLPDCYQPNDGRRRIADHTPSRADCGLPDHGLVFCCFNNTYKIAPPVFDIWMRLLAEHPDGTLWLLETNALVAGNLRREAAARGIPPARLVFAPRLPLDQHLARYRVADLFLDTFPCNAHTTASDALWAGLPVLTCAGDTFAARVAGSLLTAAGLPELITTSLGEYETLAGRLAGDAGLLARLRRRLTDNRAANPLFDSQRYARSIEAAYAHMWRVHAQGGAPAAFAIDREGRCINLNGAVHRRDAEIAEENQ